MSFTAGGALAAAALHKPATTDPAPSPPAPSASASALTSAPPPPPQIATAPVPAVPGPSTRTNAAPKPSVERPITSASARAGGEDTLAGEVALVEVARTALRQGDGAGTLRAVDEYTRRFPRGALVQEREALAIQALRLLGREDEARVRLDRFRARFPTSALLPALEAAQKGPP